MFRKLLIANRGEIACRVIRTAKRLGIPTVAVYSDADSRALHVAEADEAVRIGPAPAAQSYIDIDAVMRAVAETGADAVHPGYGFLSENASFATRLAEAGVTFVGPPASAIEAMGDKITSKKLAAEAGVSTVPGHMGLIGDADEAVRVAADVGYPVMMKASAGGGGKGMRIAHDEAQVREGFEASKREAAASFGDDRMFIERFVTSPRHIEIQVLADAHGNCISLNERECSIQRRNQKVIEEAPSPFLDAETRAAMGAQACQLAQAVGYASAGTVEFIVDGDRNFYFLEMNTRLQVEHPVTELVTGIDLVEQMLRVAAGEKLDLTQDEVKLNGWAIESRVYAEDPYRGFLPSIGRLSRYRPPEEGPRDGGLIVRNDTGVFEGGEISVHYDPMIAKLCTWGPDRRAAIQAMREALDTFAIEGIGHNLPFLSAVMDNERFVSGELTTAFIAQEFPDGFEGVDVSGQDAEGIAATVSAMNMIAQLRRTRISGALPHHKRRVGRDWVVKLDDRTFRLRLKARDEGATVRFLDGDGETTNKIKVTTDWRPGRPLCSARVKRKKSGEPAATMHLQVEPIPTGWHVRWRGASIRATVLSPRMAELAALMPERETPDTSLMLLCPMPGLVVDVAVKEGQQVRAGQALATVEAMKMENVLRAARDATVAAIRAEAGQSLAVDDVIMEFEA